MQADEKRIITDEELTEIVKVAAKAGADAAMEHFKAEKLKEMTIAEKTYNTVYDKIIEVIKARVTQL